MYKNQRILYISKPIMESRAKNFIENFKKGIDQIMEHAPKDMPFAIFIYARDPQVKDDAFPDGDIRFHLVERTNSYDRYTVRQYIEEELTTSFR